MLDSIRWLPLGLVLGCAPAPTQPALVPVPPLAHIDEARAEAYFTEAATLFARDDGKLWGLHLDGPILFLDPESREVVANRADAQGQLVARGHLFIGHVGNDVSPANSALEWAGVRWTEVLWPLPEDAPARKRLMAHEAFHRQQAALRIPMDDSGNAHLDALEGRILLQLEWRALKKAVLEQGAPRQRAIEDALVFRARRREIFPTAAQDERALEMNEGLAEYTGTTLASNSPAERRAVAAQLLDKGPAKPSFVRSFAYASGPAYGLLLDETGVPWRRSLSPASDLGALLAHATGARLPPKLEAESANRQSSYDGATLRGTEGRREEARLARAASYRARFVEGPHLVIALRKKQISFDPNQLEPLGDAGTVYRQLRVSDEWGVLSASTGALLSEDWTTVTVSTPADPAAHPLQGDGWTLQLSPGWTLKPGARKGDFTLAGPR
ncbi:hypothetical protein LZC95_07475 [Pendulispora brunnea]|uniref:Lipoprotein n=1 Tax=Pendulispora brunnea TaxID=2905690 RepID=A0ABZ2KDK9_9BACT